MPYTKTTWVDGTTMGNQTRMNNLETQFDEASNSLEQDLFTAFTLSGLRSTKDGSIANQLDVTSGVSFLLQTDNTLRRRATSASTPGLYTTSTPSTSYFLDLNPDGTFSWGTTHSVTANHLTICTVATDGSGNISTVTDTRTLNTALLAAALGGIGVPTIEASTADQVITATTLQTLCSYTAPTDMHVKIRVQGAVLLNNGTSGNSITFQVSYTDTGGGSRTASMVMQGGGGTTNVLAATGSNSFVNTYWPGTPLFFSAKAGTAITVTYRDPTNTPNDTVSAIIERLA